MDDDEEVFGQLDRLHQITRNDHSLYEPQFGDNTIGQLAHDVYGAGQPPHEGYVGMYQQPQEEYYDEPMQLDSFDENLLRQPDHDSRHGQATLGRARLSLPPARGSQHPATQQPSASQRPDLSYFAYAASTSSPSSVQRRQDSSPSLHASQRHTAPVDRPQRTNETRNYYVDEDRVPYHSQPAFQPRLNAREAPCGQAIPPNSTPAVYPTPAASRALPGGPPTVQGIDLVPTSQLPDRFRTMFPFPLFNAVQSKCFPVVYQSNDNFVVSAPTGSGKTAILELAICRLVNRFAVGSFKIVYQAPTKALCSERQRDWERKFAPLDLQCAELTGDTENYQLRSVQNASIIITTPEKWDSVTRKWKDHMKLVQMVKLFLIDEVHILKEDRGATLEAVVSRMKSVESDVRFVALSAAVPNSQDIATWLGKDSNNPQIPAPREKFGEEFRPVKLQKHVCGYQPGANDFAFEKLLNSKLPDVIAKWSQKKPLMVFCFTRKSCVETAKLLASWWASKGPRERYWEAPRRRVVVGDKDLKDTVASGVAFHHAGVNMEDRLAVEKAYLAGDLNVICCTSTLAVGVNLPCHMVIIKNTVTYHGGGVGIKEYSDLEVMQMLGRAGRPQFDDSAVAVIMTRLPRVSFYEKMVSGQEVLESCLHRNLIDHLNSEINLGTVTNVSSAKKWLTSTFLYVRLKEHPEHYQVAEHAPGANLDERLENICCGAIVQLQDNDLVEGIAKLKCTEFGDAMARYYIQFDTMKIMLALPRKAKTSEILSAISQAAEFKEIRFRQGEKSVYKDLNKNGSIKFPIPVNIDSTAHKVSLIIQAVLGSAELPTEDDKHLHEFNNNKMLIFRDVHRLIRCNIDCQNHFQDSVSARNSLMLARSLAAHVWDDSPLHIMQLPKLGPVAVRKLVAAGVKSIEDLENTEADRIERVLSYNPPFGATVLQAAKAFPRLRIGLKTIGDPVINKGVSVKIKVRAEIGFINEKLPDVFNKKPVYVCLLTDTSDGHQLHFTRVSAKKLDRGLDIPFTAELKSPSQTIRGYVMCDELAGTQRYASLKPEIPTFMFPAPKATNETNEETKIDAVAPNTSKRRAAAAASRPREEDDEFGDAGIDDADLAAAAERDEFANIDELSDDGASKSKPTAGNKKTKVTARTQSVENWEPVRLDNGNWACAHKCGDKNACKHPCCKTGLDNKPKPPKPKKPKKDTEAALDPKQTQLNLTKTKKPGATSQPDATPASTAPARKTTASAANMTPSSNAPARKVESKASRDLDRLHNSVTTSTRPVPLLKGKPASTLAKSPSLKTSKDDRAVFSDTTDEEARSSDYGLDNLGTDDFLGTTEEASTTHTTKSQGASDNFNMGLDDDDMLDVDFDDGGVDLAPYADKLSEEAAAASHDEDRVASNTKDRPIFVTGDTSSSDLQHHASPDHFAAPKRPLADSKPIESDEMPPPPLKKQKSSIKDEENDATITDYTGMFEFTTPAPADEPAVKDEKSAELDKFFEDFLGGDMFERGWKS